jgi:hypothetical protein
MLPVVERMVGKDRDVHIECEYMSEFSNFGHNLACCHKLV